MSKRHPGPPSLRREIVLWYSAVLLVALIVFAAVAYLILQRSLRSAGVESLQQTALAAEQLIVPGNVPRLGSREQRVATDGSIDALRRQTRLATGDVVEIYVARGKNTEGRALRTLLLVSVLLIPLTALAAAIGGRRVANRLLRPLDHLVGAAREIGAGVLSRRVTEPERPAEFAELARAFNGMLARLDAAFAGQRRFTADASHELRTPLTAIRGTAQVALSRERTAAELRGTLVEVLEETERMLQLVEDLLTLSRGERSGEPIPARPVHLAELLHDAGAVATMLVHEKPVTVQIDAPEELLVHGDPSLRQVFLNLVSNAAKFTDEGVIAISATSGARAPEAAPAADPGAWVRVDVRDTGRGIDPADLPHIFERFYRGDRSRQHGGGTGLGLAIVQSILERHGGMARVQSKPGRGTEIRVWLRRAETPV